MTSLTRYYVKLDEALTTWMAAHGILLLRVSLGIVFTWFGVLKFFPGMSPAQSLAADTISVLTFGLLSPETTVLILAAWETLIGLGLISGFFLRGTLFLLWTQMLGTLTPLVIFPELCFKSVPFVPTLEGQYIIKNIVLISAGLVIGATAAGGKLVASTGEASGE